MRCQENTELYLNLSRKELQVLCKSNNLPANRSKDQLAKSLSLFFEAKNATSTPRKEIPSSQKGANPGEDNSKGACEKKNILEAGNRFLCPCMKEKESNMDLQSSKNAPNSTKNAVCPDNLLPKLFGCSTSKAGGEANFYQIGTDKQLSSEWLTSGTNNEVQRYSELKRNGNTVLNHAAHKSDLCNSIPNVSNCSTKSGLPPSGNICWRETPSFQFLVMAEEGLNLHVDLNSSPAEWVNSLKDEVRTSIKMSDPKSSILNSNVVNRNCDCNTSTLSSESENCQPDATFVSSDSSVPTSSTIPVKMAGCMDGNQLGSSSATLLIPQKRTQFDSCPGNDNAFAEDSVDDSSGVEKSNASIHDISLRPIHEVSENNGYDPKINGLVYSLTSITEENNLLQFNETDRTAGASQDSIERGPIDNIENDKDPCQVSIEKEPIVGLFENAGCEDRSSNFNKLTEPHVVDCLATEAHSDAISAVSILNNCVRGFENSCPEDLVSLCKIEEARDSPVKDKDIPECSPSQNSSENNSKRPHNVDFREEFQSKRHNSNEKNTNGMMVNLRSTRTSAKETMFEPAAHPRRSSRLREGFF